MNALGKTAVSLASVALLATPMLAVAQEEADITCADLEFTSEITDVLPEANLACREVVMKDGRPFARFNATIVSNRGGAVRAKFKKAGGGFTDVYTFHPDQSNRLRLGGQNVRWWDVASGQQLDIFLPPDRFEIAVHDDPVEDFANTDVVITTVVITAAPQELPGTASIVPLLGALGAGLLALGAALGVLRRRTGA